MSLRENLTPPLVVEPTGGHTHTVIFLHRFPEGISDDELLRGGKVLSQKRTRDHKTLREQFPGVRWVFPHPKAHAAAAAGGQHWAGLSAGDESALGLTGAQGLPYITRVVLQEAGRLQEAVGAEGVVLGGQGDAALAAHDALAAVPRRAAARLAGFVGMHAGDGVVTRDVRAYGIARKTDGGGGGGGGGGVVAGTPHEFIRGGYRVQTATWGGRRIDDFAEFLEGIGVRRRRGGQAEAEAETETETKTAGGVLTPGERPGEKEEEKKRDGLAGRQKHALEVARQKAADEAHRRRVLDRIEADKVERRIRGERERQARLHRHLAQGRLALPGGGVYRLGDAPRPLGPDMGDVESFEADFWAGEGAEEEEGQEVEEEEGKEEGREVERRQFSSV